MISCFQKHSPVDVKNEHAEELMKVLDSAKFRTKPFRIDYDRKPEERDRN